VTNYTRRRAGANEIIYDRKRKYMSPEGHVGRDDPPPHTRTHTHTHTHTYRHVSNRIRPSSVECVRRCGRGGGFIIPRHRDLTGRRDALRTDRGQHAAHIIIHAILYYCARRRQARNITFRIKYNIIIV